MSGVKSQFFTDLQKLSASHLNAGSRWSGASLQEILSELIFDDAGAVSSTGRILGGLRASVVAGTMNVDVTQGAVAFKHGGSLSAIVDTTETVPETVFAKVLERTTLNTTPLTFAANASGLDRVDLIVIDWTLVTDRNISMPQKTGAPVLQDTRWSPNAVLGVLQGTPGAGAPIPSSTQQSLYQVGIPNGTNAANFDADAELLEASQPASIYRVGPGHSGYDVGIYQNAEERDVITASRRDGTGTGLEQMKLRMRLNSSIGPVLGADHWPRFIRPDASFMAAGESTQHLYPMVITGSREWSMFIPFGGGSISPSIYGPIGSGLLVLDDGIVFQVVRNLVAAQSFTISATAPLPARGLQLISAEFHWEVVVAFDGTINSDSLSFSTVTNLGVATELSALPSMGLASTGVKQDLFVPTGEPVLVADEFLKISTTISLANDGTTVGSFSLHGMSLTVREGRA